MSNDQRKFSQYFYNPLSYLGIALAAFIVAIEVFLFAMDFFSAGENIYLQLITYLILPGFLFLGLGLIPAGYLWNKRRVARSKRALSIHDFKLDLSIPQHRNGLFVFIGGTSVLLMMSMVGSYKAFHYTESVAFCGTLCHTVMEPEHTAYLNSPHARVACVECHIGAGADWYVRSKASGLRQVFRTALNSYARPIDTPIHNLRPAEETCKQCHWPGRFFSSVELRRMYYLKEEENPAWKVRMLLDVGSGEHQSAGVHAHMNLASEIFYAAEDADRLKISWIKSIDSKGNETIFKSEDSKYKDTPPKPDEIRHMDCIDCHNRPSHRFIPPFQLINSAIEFGEIDQSVPDIKEQGVEVLAKVYKDKAEAAKSIEDTLTAYYLKEYPDFYESERAKVTKAIDAIRVLYSKNMFPEMKARWDAFPDHIGHLVSPGCFRCHDGEHTSDTGKTITNDCKSCHIIVEQGKPEELERNIAGLEFKHPGGGKEWKESACTECHTGGSD